MCIVGAQSLIAEIGCQGYANILNTWMGIRVQWGKRARND
jgi:hypothetical protein